MYGRSLELGPKTKSHWGSSAWDGNVRLQRVYMIASEMNYFWNNFPSKIGVTVGVQMQRERDQKNKKQK